MRFSLVLSVNDIMLSSASRTFSSNNVKVKLRVVLTFCFGTSILHAISHNNYGW